MQQSCDPNSTNNPLVNGNVLPHVCANESTLQTILTIAFGLIGGLAVLFIIIGGLRYIMAQGDPAKISTAKNQILYAAIGLVIAGSAEFIVNYILNF